jgi:ubiquinone/menaquinone biosynthesis C-methylase UbiE
MDERQRQTNDYFSRVWRDRLHADTNPAAQPNLDLEWHMATWKSVMAFWAEIFTDFAPGKGVLECGGATGLFPLYMAKAGWKFTITDITREGLVLARSRLMAADVPGRFARADVCSLPFDNASFDVVTSHGLLDLFPDIRLPIREMTRVLKPGGLFTASAYPKRPSVQALADLALPVGRLMRRVVRASRRQSRVEARDHQYALFRNDYPVEEYVKACREAGLSDVVATGVLPFPRVRLPARLQRGYIRLIREVEALSLSFNRSRAWWTANWGLMLALYGVKKSE